MNISPPTDAPDTRERLLQAAGEVFAEQGFRRATVREICARAGANIAAINYHYRDKEGLYAEVMQSGIASAIQKYPPDMGLEAGTAAPVERRLHAFVRSLLYRLLGEGPHAWQGKLMLWEMVEPTAALDRLLKETIRPLYLRLEEMVTQLLGPAATPERLRMGIVSTLGQCMVYRTMGPLLSRVQPGSTDFTDNRIEALAEHVTRMVVAGLRSYVSAAADGATADSERGSHP
jgi:TetR/AcrR family transcriptional regulator, regulator of cefoperazone and chloramphenicol sensitivity